MGGLSGEVRARQGAVGAVRAPAAFQWGAGEVLLAGLAGAVAEWRQRRGQDPSAGLLVDVEGHGREPLGGLADLSRTVGWFTSVHPVRLELGTAHPGQVGAGGPAAGRGAQAVQETRRAATA